MRSNPIVTLSFFRFNGWSARWWAFRQMGLAPRELPEVAGLRFFKMLGSGGGNGFSIRPHFGQYGLLGVWDQEDDARRFFAGHPLFQAFLQQGDAQWTLFLETAAVHGKWDGRSPFPITADLASDRPIAVLTRATIRTRHLLRFWRNTPPVSRSMEDKPGLLFAAGIGELPIVLQATFSLWCDTEAMEAYAYHSPRHREVIRQTRQLGWYKEELFARFHPFDSMGGWEGVPDL